jgi:hypothetical protein
MSDTPIYDQLVREYAVREGLAGYPQRFVMGVPPECKSCDWGLCTGGPGCPRYVEPRFEPFEQRDLGPYITQLVELYHTPLHYVPMGGTR